MQRSARSAVLDAAAPLPSLRQLRYLVVLAEHLHFRAAADACFVTQSTLSAGIKELEGQLGAQLVERDRRCVRLTPAGAAVVGRARVLLSQAADLVAEASASREPFAAPFRLGAIPTVAPFLFPRALPRLRKRYPGLQLFLREDLTVPLLERVHAGELDAAVIATPFATGSLALRELFGDEFWFVARAGDPRARARTMALARLDTSDLLLLEEGHCLRDHAISACGTRDGARVSGIEATSLPTLLQMVEGGLGVTLLPGLALRGGLLKATGLVARPFAAPVPTRTIVLAARASSARGRDLDLLASVFSGHGSA